MWKFTRFYWIVKVYQCDLGVDYFLASLKSIPDAVNLVYSVIVH